MRGLDSLLSFSGPPKVKVTFSNLINKQTFSRGVRMLERVLMCLLMCLLTCVYRRLPCVHRRHAKIGVCLVVYRIKNSTQKGENRKKMTEDETRGETGDWRLDRRLEARLKTMTHPPPAGQDAAVRKRGEGKQGKKP